MKLKTLANILKSRNLTMSVCESCTGGMLGSMITSLPGSSFYFAGGIIAYSNAVKEKFGIQHRILLRYGAVSKQTAGEMAKIARQQLMTDIGIGITGIAGPDGGSKGKPLGLVYIAISSHDTVRIERYLLKGRRNEIRHKACDKALDMIIDQLPRN
ncbi:hypothetical protein A2Y85_01260 [candidate division WOR-3 bacterium RBG_13_43_14]|uniref:CinA C-terminal domain-containing protein n=1 Tax=candidate division WOR-3 bacterium RBG_13_43_14 TaxID=1802590 RepID=A0A1F4UDY5_UNCW3|nr:MAG: hypothetical protein A2Y85_01260 [candidate division WOR-3 bacterium RBG_13_43_14]